MKFKVTTKRLITTPYCPQLNIEFTIVVHGLKLTTICTRFTSFTDDQTSIFGGKTAVKGDPEHSRTFTLHVHYDAVQFYHLHIVLHWFYIAYKDIN